MNKKVIYVLSITIIIITSIIAIIIFNGFINMSDIKNTNAKLNSNEAIELKLNKADSDNEELYVRINNLSISAIAMEGYYILGFQKQEKMKKLVILDLLNLKEKMIVIVK